MIGTSTRRFTKRFQSVNVLTMAALREYLEQISSPGCHFRVESVGHDRVTVKVEIGTSKRPHPAVVLPAYPTGHADDLPGNPNVVLDPVEFLNTENHGDREVFAPLIGHDVLVHYEKMHPSTVMPFNRCC